MAIQQIVGAVINGEHITTDRSEIEAARRSCHGLEYVTRDRAKLVADFILHPAMTLPPDFATEFRTRSTRLYGRDAVFATRLAILLPCYNLRWCMILLNEFHTDRLARRRFAGDKRSVETIVDQQLGKAKGMLETLACRTD